MTEEEFKIENTCHTRSNDKTMTIKKGISYYKDWIYIIIFAITIISFVGKAALLSDQVNRNKAVIEQYNPEILNYRLGEIEKKVNLIYDKLIE